MVQLEDIPDCAFCPRCGQPYKVIDLTLKAARLGYKLPEGSYVFRCCEGVELTIEDRAAANVLRDLLLEYHAQQ